MLRRQLVKPKEPRLSQCLQGALTGLCPAPERSTHQNKRRPQFKEEDSPEEGSSPRFCLVSVLPYGGGGVWQNFRVGGCPTTPPPRVGWDFVGALGSIEPVPLLSFFCCRFRVTCLFMVCLHVIAYHVCMPHAHKGARMLCRLCWMRRGQR